MSHRDNVATAAAVCKIEADAVIQRIGGGGLHFTDGVGLGQGDLVNNNGRSVAEPFVELDKGGYFDSRSGQILALELLLFGIADKGRDSRCNFGNGWRKYRYFLNIDTWCFVVHRSYPFLRYLGKFLRVMTQP